MNRGERGCPGPHAGPWSSDMARV